MCNLRSKKYARRIIPRRSLKWTGLSILRRGRYEVDNFQWIRNDRIVYAWDKRGLRGVFQ